MVRELKPQGQNLRACKRKLRLSSTKRSCTCKCCGVRKVPFVHRTGCSCFIDSRWQPTITSPLRRIKGKLGWERLGGASRICKDEELFHQSVLFELCLGALDFRNQHNAFRSCSARPDGGLIVS